MKYVERARERAMCAPGHSTLWLAFACAQGNEYTTVAAKMEQYILVVEPRFTGECGDMLSWGPNANTTLAAAGLTAE